MIGERSLEELAEELRIIARHRKRLSAQDCSALALAADWVDRVGQMRADLIEAQQREIAKNERIIALQGQVMSQTLRPMSGTLVVTGWVTGKPTFTP